MADRSISIALEARVQGFVSGMRTAQKATDDFANRTAAFARDNEQNLDRVGKASMVLGGAMLAGVGLAVKSFMDFDVAMSEVQASTHETSANMDLLREAAINAGADTAFSAEEAAKGIDELAKAGVSTKDILAGGLSGALSLAAAGSLGVGEAAEIAASALTQFKLSGDKVPHLADLLSAAAGKAQGSVQDMGAALNQTGLVAASTGLTIEETTGGLAAFASAGLVGSDAGTSFKSMLQRLTPQSKEAEEKMRELGISAYDAQGNFVGLAQFSENLKTSMADLTPEARNAAMGVIFGSDAVRAANVLYEQGAEGIAEWTDKVNESGYAAVTASIKQDNLRGDIEKLGGSLDSVFLKSGSGANDVLRSLAQSAEGFVDAVGKIPAPILSAGLGIAGIAGGALLLGGALMSALPRVMEFRTSMADLAEASPRAASGIGKVAKAAGIAAAAMAVLQVAGAVFTVKHTEEAEAFGQALLKVAKNGSDASGLDSLFQDWDKLALGETAADVDSVSDAIGKLTNQNFGDWLNKNLADPVNGFMGFAKSDVSQIEARLRGLGDEMGNLAKNGAADTAAKSFQALTKEFEANGQGAQEALNHVPGYRDALLSLANQAGVTLEGQDLLDFAMGKVPASMQGATAATETYTTAAGTSAPVTEEMADALEDVGLSADGAVTSIDSFAKSLFAAGLLSLSASDANIAYQGAIDDLTAAVAKNGTTLDINTAAGRANQSAFNGVAQAAITAATATAEETLATHGSAAAQKSLQGSLKGSYRDLVAAAGQLGITGAAADAMARKALGIPKNIPIDTWVNDKATSELNRIRGNADNLNGKTVTLYAQADISKAQASLDYLRANSMIEANAYASGSKYRKASGGRVYGPGTTTSDSIPHMLSRDEYVIKASAAQAIGYGTLDRLNAGDTQPLKYAPAPAPQRAFMSAYSGDSGGRSVNANFTINEVSDPIGTAHATLRRLSTLAV